MNKFAFAIVILLGLLFESTVAWGQFVHNLQGDKLPWTFSPAFKGANYRFVVVGDLTGGEQAGVFDMAIDRINDLAPDFVITVGDVIEGYTYDNEQVENQWNAVENSLSRLDMPFFMVGGNHDLTNDMMLHVWKERFGYDYYSFYAGKALFIILNTAEPGGDGFSDHQLRYMKEVVDKHPKRDPVFVFSHHPFWQLSNRPGYDEISNMFLDRPATWFCGHEHRYLHRQINGQPHYMLAGLASGGLRGQHLGEFFNLMHVNVNEAHIRIANIDLNGLLPRDIVSDDNDKQVRILRRMASIAGVRTTVLDGYTGDEIVSDVMVRNPGDYPLEVFVEAPIIEGMEFSPANMHFLLQPGDALSHQIALIAEGDMLDFAHLQKLPFTIDARFRGGEQELTNSGVVTWAIDRVRHSKPHTAMLSAALLSELPAEVPYTVDEDWDWGGIDDACFAIHASHDDDTVYIELVVYDNQFVAASEQLRINDALSLYYSNDTIPGVTQQAHFLFEPGKTEVTLTDNTGMMQGVITDHQYTGDIFFASLKIPRKVLKGDYYRINIAYEDVDVALNMDHSKLWWKPRWGSGEDYSQSGVFLLK